MHCDRCGSTISGCGAAHECGDPTAVRFNIGEPEAQRRISDIMTGGHLTEGLNPHLPQPGIFDAVDFDTYLAWPHVSQSSLKPMLISPAHYRHALDNPPDPNKECFQFGRLCHAGKLEPLEALRTYVVMPDLTEGLTDDKGEPYKKPRATSAYKAKVEEFHRVNAGKEIVSQDWFDKLTGITDALNRHPLARDWLGSDGPSELSLVWDEPLTGLRCKSRIDKLPNGAGLIIDLKTTGRDATTFERDIANFGYDVQAAFYCDAHQVLTGKSLRFGIVVVEKEPPHAVRAAVVDQDTIAAGRFKYRRALRQLAACRESNHWPAPSDPPAWSIPSYAQPEITLTQSGQPLVTL